MTKTTTESKFNTRLLCPANPGSNELWAFIVLPKAVSDTLPRRGRTTVEGTINDYPFRATLDPDGKLSHWLKVDSQLSQSASIAIGDTVTLKIAPVAQEPEPKIPADLQEALAGCPEAEAAWDATTNIARLDWIHWLDSAKQSATRKRRINNACDMLSSGKRRVCCFDPSGFYSKAFDAPKAAE